MARRSRATGQLRTEVNRRFPLRDTGSDGWIGDAAHRSRPSDHNPNSRGVVTAEDFDADLVPGDRDVGDVLWAFLLSSRDRRIKYVIYRGRMFSSYPVRGFVAWQPRPYHGSNGHFSHLHLSVSADPDLYDDDRPWGFADDDQEDEMRQGSPRKGDVRKLQTRLNGVGESLTVDGDFGPRTAAAVKRFQEANGLTADGVASAMTLTHLQAVAHGLGSHAS